MCLANSAGVLSSIPDKVSSRKNFLELHPYFFGIKIARQFFKEALLLIIINQRRRLFFINVETVLNRFAPMASSSIKQQEGRARMIPVLWEIFLRSPIYGSGPDRYQYELSRRAMPYLAEKQQTISAHNLALLLLVETGIIGFVLFAVGLSKAVWSAWKARLGPCGFLPLAWLLPMTIAGLTIASPLYNPVFWLALGYALAGPNPELSYAYRINRFQP